MTRAAFAWGALLVGLAVATAPFAPVGRVEVGDLPPIDRPAGLGAPASAQRSVPGSWSPRGGPEARPDSGRSGPPLRVRVAALRVDAPVVPVGVQPDGALDLPSDPQVVGWWRDGPGPGSAAGTVVLAGHVDTYTRGRGALFHLAELRPGDAVVLATAAGESGYEVRAVRWYPKSQLPAEAFATVGAPRLVLITCGGEFDRRSRHYEDNVVVYASPAGGPR